MARTSFFLAICATFAVVLLSFAVSNVHAEEELLLNEYFCGYVFLV
jgi:hypothetical protein